MLMTALFRLGYVISVCDNPAEAIDYVKEDPTAWDLVITDQSMPELSGTDLIASIKALRPDLPCIICTGFPNGLTEEAARLAGADGLVIKPVDIGRFSLLVKDLIHL
jgi:CheY-like chemotaxis protein